MSRHRTAAATAAGRAASLLPFVAAGLFGCGQEEPPPAPPPPTVVAGHPVQKTVVDWDDYTARLRAVKTVDIRPRVGGYLQELHFTDGQMVAAGDKLFTIDPRPYEAALAEANGRLGSAKAELEASKARRTQTLAADVQAEAALELRDTQLARSKKLVGQGAATQESYDIEASQRKQAAADVAAARANIKSAEAAIQTAAAAVATAEAAVGNAELNLSFTEVTSPIAGRTSRHLVDVGNLVVGGDAGAATLLTTVVSLDPIYAFVSAPEEAYLKYVREAASGTRPSSRTVKNPAVLKLADEDDFGHVGAIDFVDNQLDAATDTMTGRLQFPNPDGSLTPGLFGKVQILGSGRYEATLIPDAAISIEQDKSYVTVVVDRSPEETKAGPATDGPVDAEPPPSEPGGGGPAAPAAAAMGKTVARKEVTTGPLLGGLRVIRDGLSTSDLVVTRGLQNAQPGSPVMVETVPIALDEEAFDRAVRLDLVTAVSATGENVPVAGEVASD